MVDLLIHFRTLSCLPSGHPSWTAHPCIASYLDPARHKACIVALHDLLLLSYLTVCSYYIAPRCDIYVISNIIALLIILYDRKLSTANREINYPPQ